MPAIARIRSEFSRLPRMRRRRRLKLAASTVAPHQFEMERDGRYFASRGFVRFGSAFEIKQKCARVLDFGGEKYDRLAKSSFAEHIRKKKKQIYRVPNQTRRTSRLFTA